MKTFNIKLICVLILTSLLASGCMPDSLTKFKKEPPKKSASAVVGTGDGEPDSPIVDSSGNPVPIDTITFPTTFYYLTEGSTPVRYMTVATPVTYNSTTDGTLADAAKRSLIFVRCELDQTGPIITRSLPPGLTLNTTTCAITGTPSAVHTDTTPGSIGEPITYTINMLYKSSTYSGPGTEDIMSASIKLGSYVKLVDANGDSAMGYSSAEKYYFGVTAGTGSFSDIKTNTDYTANYDKKGIITTANGVRFVVKVINSTNTTIGVQRATPIVVTSAASFAVNGYISTAGGKKGKIIRIDSATNTLYIDNISSNTVWAAGDALDNVLTYVATETSIVSVDYESGLRLNSLTFDNDLQYFSSKFTINLATSVFEVATAMKNFIPLASTPISEANGVNYSISPALPPGLSFDTDTGIISGTFPDLQDPTLFTITATNPLDSKTTQLRMQAIQAPKDLSYTNRQLIAVNSNALFLDGENLFQSVTVPPLAPVITRGRILKNVSTNLMSIQTVNGKFIAEGSLDSGNAYFSEKTFITTASSENHFNLALTVASAASFSAGEYVSTAAGAKGIIVYSDTTNNVLYIRFLTPDTSSIIAFKEGDNIDDAATYVGAETTISEVEAEAMLLTLTSPTAGTFNAGHDITSDASSSGYVYAVAGSNTAPDPTILKVSDVNRSGANYFRIGQNLDNQEYYSVADGTISQVSHDNLIIVTRGEVVNFNSVLTEGTTVRYSISPALPSGLTMDASTGVISGTATVRVPAKAYVVTVTNILGTTTFGFNLEVRDYFAFADTTGAKSFLTHKIGSFRNNRNCRINATDILSGTNTSALDIGCYVEAEELELFYTKLKMTANVGPGVCESVSMRPFAFWKYAPYKTARTVNYVNGCSDAAGLPANVTTTAPTAADLCYGDYTSDDGPNCDEGEITVVTYTTVVDNETTIDPFLGCELSSTTQTATTKIQCGGKKSNCLGGPITDIVPAAARELGFDSTVIASTTGLSKTYEITSPFDSGDVTNLRNANSVANNSCTDTRAQANTLYSSLASTSSINSPFGARSPFYEFFCLDAAQDVKARIRVNVRDWNRTFNILDSITSLIPAKMNDNTAPVFGTTYNNRTDWDDDFSNYDGDGDVTTGGAAIPACNRAGVVAPACSDPAYPTKRACLAAGSCSDVAYPAFDSPDEATCLGRGEIWTNAGETWSTGDYVFPEDNI